MGKKGERVCSLKIHVALLSSFHLFLVLPLLTPSLPPLHLPSLPPSPLPPPSLPPSLPPPSFPPTGNRGTELCPSQTSSGGSGQPSMGGVFLHQQQYQWAWSGPETTPTGHSWGHLCVHRAAPPGGTPIHEGWHGACQAGHVGEYCEFITVKDDKLFEIISFHSP